MKISFLGLGQMGKGMAMNLGTKCECDYLVNDLSDEMFPDFHVKGINTTTNISDTWDSDIIFLCLPNTKVVEAVTMGNGLIEHLKAGQIVVDCSTIAYLNTIKIAEAFEEKGIYFIDAPISGRQSGAEDGTLTIMCGGNEEAFDKAKPYLDMMGSNVLYMGQKGSGQLTKMINNCIYDINIAAFCELLTVGTKLGLDPVQIGSAINSGSAKSGASQFFVPQMLEGKFDYGFTMLDAYKDIESCVEITSLKGFPVPMLDAMNSIYKMTLLKGYGNYYKGAMVRVYEELLDVKFRKKGFENT